jgi:type VI secretion system secreted protein Hcp
MASDIFAKLGDIKGESVDAKHKDEIEVLSFSWGVTNPPPPVGSGGGAGKAIFQDLVIVHRIDKASPVLMQACAAGQHLKDATITHRKAGKGQHEYLIVKLDDVLITAVAHSGNSGQPDTGSETVSLSFGKVDLEYRPQQPDGSPDAGIRFKYDLKNNKTF